MSSTFYYEAIKKSMSFLPFKHITMTAMTMKEWDTMKRLVHFQRG